MARLKYFLPEEMVIQILYWLPVQSLLRFRSVCQSWRSIISDPEFIKTHSYYRQIIMASKKASLLMITHSDFVGQPRFDSPDFNCYLYTPLGPLGSLSVIGSCNGIILCELDVEPAMDYYLWNPSTMQSKKLPRFPGHEKVGDTYKLAFGFDPISNDYKVLRLTRERGVAPVLQLYSTNTDSWKEIHVDETSSLRVLCYPRLRLGPVINGAMYMRRKKQILSFDLHNEVSTVVPIPSSMKSYSDILDFEGSVAVIFGSIGEVSRFSLWTLDDIHGNVSWTKKFDIDDVSWMSSYLGGGLLYGRKDHVYKSSLYDYRKKDFKYFPVPQKDLQKVLKYTETLASVEGFKPNRYGFGNYASLM